MREYLIKNSDKSEYYDITVKLRKLLKEVESIDEEKVIRFEKGEYHFYSDYCESEILYASNTDSERFPEKKTAINIIGHNKLTIDGSGSTFIMHGKMIAVKVENSSDIILKNFQWDFPCAATLEMKLIKKRDYCYDYSLPKASEWEIKGKNLLWYERSPVSDKKYWENIGQKDSYCVVVNDEGTGNLCRYSVADGPFAMAIRIKKLNSNTIRVYTLKKMRVDFKEGDVFELCADKKRDCVGAFFGESSNLRAENITVRYMHGFSWLSQMCENISFINCDFTPSEKSDRKCTSFADHLHFSGTKGKVHIEGCNFSNAHDDPINIHGTFTVAKKRIDDYTILTEYEHNQQRGFRQYHKGDKVVFYLRENLSSFESERVFTVRSVVNPLEKGCSAKQMIVSFDEKLPDELCIKNKYALENITYTPEVYIGGCSFSSIPTRGILCTTRGNTVIENNIFDGMTMSSIYISDDCNSWFESGAVRNMIIRNNIFYIKKAPNFSGTKAGVLIEPIVKNEDKTEECIHKNISVINNTFYLEEGSAVDGRYTDHLVIKENRILAYGDFSAYKPSAYKTYKCKNTVIDNNYIDNSLET